MKKSKIREIELLAPAKDATIAIDAINYGADAVYMGAQKFGARSQAGNTIDEMAKVADYAHRFNAKLYATVNTIVYDSELKEVEKTINKLYRAGVDALIVQDMSILRMDIPPIALHSSTQCDLRTPEKARFLSDVGFSQLVMARELTLEEISRIHNATDAKLEAFVYGALCVSYSGRCQISEAMMHRSANRGECAQVCRMSYDLLDENKNVLIENKHLLSLKDLNQSGRLQKMIEAGVSSFKIEGRLKDSNYVRNSVAYFRRELDEILALCSDKYVRSSNGVSNCDFSPALEKCFNRTFTHYFLDERKPANGVLMASMKTPKSQGEYLGRLLYKNHKNLRIDTKKVISNGDGLSFYNGSEFAGFRVNKCQRGVITTLQDVFIPNNAEIFRTYDKAYDDAINASRTTRKIRVDFTLRDVNDSLVLDVKDERGNEVTTSIDVETLNEAKSDQRARQAEAFGKLGDTIYSLNNCEILTRKFVPASVLNGLRRQAIELLDETQAISYRSELRKKEIREALCYTDCLESADNVANRRSKDFYRSHGVKHFAPAIELREGKDISELPLMHIRYCLRRELGACKMSAGKSKLPDKLFLRTGNNILRVETDCKNCEMKLYLEK